MTNHIDHGPTWDLGEGSYLWTSARRVGEQAARLGIDADDVVGLVDEHVREVIHTSDMLREEAVKARVIALLREQGYTVTPPEECGGHGWFVDHDEEPEVPGYAWRVFLQCEGHVVPLDIAHPTEDAAEEWLRANVAGRGVLL